GGGFLAGGGLVCVVLVGGFVEFADLGVVMVEVVGRWGVLWLGSLVLGLWVVVAWVMALA
ncbi:hypothetical protein, partial [Pseudomonas syringae group genomosp. 7]|uniref:hypothetical protein n=1 Tax=Pseudomonas syringae group genomosp. 7 TaxID=251699 RepID=UPI00376FF6F5